MERVIAYIDGFNLYFGMKESNLRHCYWLDVHKMVQSLLKDHQTLVRIRYFTARISAPEAKRQRQVRYLEALGTLESVDIIEGKYMDEDRNCPHCNKVFIHPNEKMTDVNIAVHLLTDAYQDKFDTALLISGDSDLVPPVKMVRSLFPTKRIIAALPPNRVSAEQRMTATAHFTIWHGLLEKSCFPNAVQRADGHILQNPWAPKPPPVRPSKRK